MADELSNIWKVLNLIEEEKDNIRTEDDSIDNTTTLTKNWLVGKLHTNRPFNKTALMGTMKVIWKLMDEVEITALEENLFLFKFSGSKDKERVLEGAPWSFDKHMLLFQDFKGELKPEEYVFNTAHIWIRIYELPLGMRNKNTRIRIEGKLGRLIAMDESLADEDCTASQEERENLTNPQDVDREQQKGDNFSDLQQRLGDLQVGVTKHVFFHEIGKSTGIGVGREERCQGIAQKGKPKGTLATPNSGGQLITIDEASPVENNVAQMKAQPASCKNHPSKPSKTHN
ncbi:hypothetical protein PTKIN_Ptkin10aG0112000 [Pterospermum kingtungense]